MSSLSDMINRLNGVDLDRALGLRPPYPPVALEVDRDGAVLVRLKRKRRGRPVLEAHAENSIPAESVPGSIFQPVTAEVDGLAERLGELFENSGTRPGRVALVLPDNLAKITLLKLPERPASRRQMDELVRARMRRAVPFKIEDARLSYQLFTGDEQEVSVLVVLVRKALVERFESAFRSIGAVPGLIDICTPNLINLCRSGLSQASREGGDAALLNCSRDYFSLAIVRRGQLIFIRCKTLAPGDSLVSGGNGVLKRELANSLSYYREKLEGQGVQTVYVRSATIPLEEIAARLEHLGFESIQPVDPGAWIDLGSESTLDPVLGQRIAPAIGAAAGRGK